MPHHLTIVGVGPGDPTLRSLAAQAALDAATCIVLRTAVHPGVEDVAGDRRTRVCDDLYADAASFEALYPAIVARVLQALAVEDVVYAVPGSPTGGERTVALLRRAAVDAGHAVTVVPGVGGLDVVAATARLDLMSDSVQVVDATLLAEWLDAQPFGGWLLPVVPSRPVIVTQVYNAEMLTSASAALSSLYPDDHPIALVDWDDDAASPRRTDTTLFELHSVHVDHLSSLVVPAMVERFATRSPFALDRIVAYLRSPEGCPWDREQTNASLLPSVVEEAFEVADAVGADDDAALADELGDLLLQPVMQAQVAGEDDRFDLADIFEAIGDKLIRRHPHVFGDESADSPDDVLDTWRRVKDSERSSPRPSNPYDRLPRSMPASLKVRRLLTPTGTTIDRSEAASLARSVAEALVRLTEAGHDADALVDAECRILVDRALGAATRKD